MKKDLTTGKVFKTIMLFALPLMLGAIFQQFYNMTDSIVVGNYMGANSLAAVNSAGPIVFIVLGFAQGLAQGFTVITSQYYGNGDENGVRRSFATSIILSMIVTVVLTVLSLTTTDWLLEVTNVPAEIYAETKTYMNIIYWGIIAAVYYNLFAGILRSVGNSMAALVFLFVSAVSNIFLDIWFVGYTPLGVAGAAIATVIAQGLSVGLCYLYIIFKYPVLRLHRHDFKMSWAFSLAHFKTGVPMALQMTVIGIGLIVVQGSLNTFGVEAIDAYGVSSKIELILSQPLAATGLAMAAFVGQNYGAGKMDRVKEGFKAAFIIVAVYAVLAAGLTIVTIRALVSVFLPNPSQTIIDYSETYIFAVIPFYLFLGSIFILRNALEGLGQSLIPFIGCVLELVGRFFAAVFLAKAFGFIGICMSAPVAWVLINLLQIPYTIYLFRKPGRIKEFQNIATEKSASVEAPVLP